MTIQEAIKKLKAGENKEAIEATLSEQRVIATDMLEQLEVSTGKRWKIVRYASKSGMKTGTEELAPFFDKYCEPSGGIIFASDNSELNSQDFVMLDDSEPALNRKENIVVKCGVYHIRYGNMDRDIKNTIISDTTEVDLLRRSNSVIGAYACKEKTKAIDVFDIGVDPRITAYAERVLEEAFKGVDINLEQGTPRKKR